MFLERTDDESFLHCPSGHEIRVAAMKCETEKRRATQNDFGLTSGESPYIIVRLA